MKIKSFFLLTLCVFVFSLWSLRRKIMPAVSVAQSSIESMVTEIFDVQNEVYNLPDGAGVVVYIETPEGSARGNGGVFKKAQMKPGITASPQ